MSLILGKCHENIRTGTHLNRNYLNRHYPNDTVIRNCIIRMIKSNSQNSYTIRIVWNYRLIVLDSVDIELIISILIISIRRIISCTVFYDQLFHEYWKDISFTFIINDLVQALTSNDFENRFCNWAQRKMRDGNFFSSVLFSNEVTFTNIDHVNRRNSHYWSERNPHWYDLILHQRSWSVNVWCGIVLDKSSVFIFSMILLRIFTTSFWNKSCQNY